MNSGMGYALFASTIVNFGTALAFDYYDIFFPSDHHFRGSLEAREAQAIERISNDLHEFTKQFAENNAQQARVAVNNYGDASLRFTQSQVVDKTDFGRAFEISREGTVLIDPNNPKQASFWEYFHNAVRFRGKGYGRSSPSGYSSLVSYVSSHKREIVAKLLFVLYLYSNYRLFSLSLYVQSQERWLWWKSDMTLAQLLEINQQDLALELIAAIHKKYNGSSQKFETAECFVLFLKDIDEEVHALQNYQALVYWIIKLDELQRRCLVMCSSCAPKVLGFAMAFTVDFLSSCWSIKSLFYIDEKLGASVQEHLARLALYKRTLLHWVADSKVRRMRSILAKPFEVSFASAL